MGLFLRAHYAGFHKIIFFISVKITFTASLGTLIMSTVALVITSPNSFSVQRYDLQLAPHE